MIIFRKMKIATRIGLVVGVLILMMLILVVVEIKGQKSIQTTIDQVVGDYSRRVQLVQEMRYQARHGAVLLRNILLVSSRAMQEEELVRFEQSVAEYESLLAQYEEEELAVAERKILTSIKDDGTVTYHYWRAAIEHVLNEAGPDSVVQELLDAEVRSRQWGWLENLQRLVELEQQHAARAMELARKQYGRMKSMVALIYIFAISAGCLLVIVITASIAGPLQEIKRRVDLIADGNFNTRIDEEREDEIGSLAGHINRMVERLQENENELNEYRYNLEELIEWRTGEVNEQRERFISVLIHDLKGPIIPIIGFSRLLMKKKHLTSEQISGYAKAIHDSASKLLFTVEQTSQDLREKRFAYSFDKTPFDFEELLCAVAKGFESAFTEREIAIRVNGLAPGAFEGEGTISFLGDIGKMRSMLENLIGNAGKYADGAVEVSIQPKDESVELIVDDDGCGIQQAFRSRIFEEYYQVPGSRGGTGMGLYSVKRIVDHYQGTITVNTSPIGGARFVVWLPMDELGSN